MGEKLIRFDWAVKKLLRSKANFGILEGFLSELLKKEITIIDILESEGNQESKEDKFNRVDLKARNSAGEIIFIEVQVETEHDFLTRMLYGTAKIITEHLKKGAPYSEVKKVYSVNIVYFDLGTGDDYVYVGQTSFKGLHTNTELGLNEKQQLLYSREKVAQIYPEYYLIKVDQFDDYAKDTLDEWIYFLKNEEIKEEFQAKGLKEAREKLRVMQLPKSEQQDYQRHLENLHYKASMVESSFKVGMKEGFIAGEKKGVIRGLIEGEKKGVIRGLVEGEKKGKLEVARKMLATGMTPAQVAELTGLSTTELQTRDDD